MAIAEDATLKDIEAALAERRSIEWLMSSEEAPDFAVVLAELLNRPEWHKRAACRGAGPDLFFPERGRRDPKARAFCESCQVRSQCLDSVLQRPQEIPDDLP